MPPPEVGCISAVHLLATYIVQELTSSLAPALATLLYFLFCPIIYLLFYLLCTLYSTLLCIPILPCYVFLFFLLLE